MRVQAEERDKERQEKERERQGEMEKMKWEAEERGKEKERERQMEMEKMRWEAEEREKEKERERQMSMEKMKWEAEEREKERQEKEAERRHQLEMRRYGPERGALEEMERARAKTPKLPPFVDGKDEVDAFLQRFERFASSNGWREEVWASNLSALLTGKALEVYSRLSNEDAQDYQKGRVTSDWREASANSGRGITRPYNYVGARPKLQLAARTKPVGSPHLPAPGKSQWRIFGGAKPVDTAARERVIEEQLSLQKVGGWRQPGKGQYQCRCTVPSWRQ
ncbi:hypothetical protein Bbelb_133910 [Branchiostoma belcheri]|nr:hypothetical protein Bbelb_133910 [Branchiostoma belcheri]